MANPQFSGQTQYSLDDIMDFIKIANAKIQTITYYGIEPKEIWHSLKKIPIKGIDRIVPIGKALEIGFDWDGKNIVNNLSRLIQTS